MNFKVDMPVFSSKKISNVVIVLLFSWVGVGWLATFAGMVGLLYPVLSISLFIPFFLLIHSGRLIWSDLKEHDQGDRISTILFIILFLTLLSHAAGVFLPETGFDALWYHLPLIAEYVQEHRLVMNPLMYQSLYPQLGDMIFALGFQVGGVFGAKVVAYAVMLSVLASVYAWSREEMDVRLSLATTSVVALFQVVGWQASSIYVDLISGLFLIGSCWLLFSKKIQDRWSILSMVFFASLLATKFINLASIPLFLCFFLYYLIWQNNHLQSKLFAFFTVITSIILASFYYLRAKWYTGSLLYPIGTQHAVPVIEQMQRGGWSDWLMHRLVTLYRFPTDFFLFNDGYTTILFILFIPFALYILKKSQDARIQFLPYFLVGGYGFAFWWFFPPPSTRYVIGQVIVLWIGWMILVSKHLKTQSSQIITNGLFSVIIVTLILHLTIRLAVNTRAVPYLLGFEDQQQYLSRFKNGFTDEKIEAFYPLSN